MISTNPHERIFLSGHSELGSPGPYLRLSATSPIVLRTLRIGSRSS